MLRHITRSNTYKMGDCHLGPFYRGPCDRPLHQSPGRCDSPFLPVLAPQKKLAGPGTRWYVSPAWAWTTEGIVIHCWAQHPGDVTAACVLLSGEGCNIFLAKYSGDVTLLSGLCPQKRLWHIPGPKPRWCDSSLSLFTGGIVKYSLAQFTGAIMTLLPSTSQ